MFKKLNYILGKGDMRRYIFFLSLNILFFLLEFISLSSLPLFVATLVNPDLVLSKIKLIKFLNFEELINDQNIVYYSAILVVSSFYLKNILLGFFLYFENEFYRKIRTNLSDKLFGNFINMPYVNHVNKNQADYSNLTLFNIEHFTAYMENINTFSREIVTLIVLFLIVTLAEPKAAFVVIVLFSLIFVLYKYFARKKISKWAKVLNQLRSSILKTLNESFGAIQEIKIFNQENNLQRNYSEKITIYEKNRSNIILARKFPKIFLELSAISLIVIISIIYFLFSNDTKSILTILSVYLVVSVRFIPAFNSLSNSYGYLRVYKPGFEAIYKQIQEIINFSIDNKKMKKRLDQDDKNLKKNYIKIDNLSFSYKNQSHDKSLNNISINIDKGDIVGITGESGSGKSTLFYLLLGLLIPEKGNIFFQGKSIFNNLENWRKKIGYISQNVFLFDGTIKDNISFNLSEKNKFNDKELIDKVIEISQLRKTIDQMPNKLETLAGSNGIKLSGGEKQRIAAARTLYRKPDIIFLDEFTSSLDLENEQKITEGILKFAKGKTIFLITHRHQLLEFCNINIILKNGKISEIKNNKLL